MDGHTKLLVQLINTHTNMQKKLQFLNTNEKNKKHAKPIWKIKNTLQLQLIIIWKNIKHIRITIWKWIVHIRIKYTIKIPSEK